MNEILVSSFHQTFSFNSIFKDSFLKLHFKGNFPTCIMFFEVHCSWEVKDSKCYKAKCHTLQVVGKGNKLDFSCSAFQLGPLVPGA